MPSLRSPGAQESPQPRTSARVFSALLAATVAVCGCGEIGSTDANAEGWLGAERRQCVDIINGYRRDVGVGPVLARWADAEPCADSQAQSDSQTGEAHGAFGRCGEHAQNECPGWGGTPAELVTNCLASMFKEGPGADYQTHGHYINMTNSSYTSVACGFYQTAAGRWWALQDFR